VSWPLATEDVRRPTPDTRHETQITIEMQFLNRVFSLAVTSAHLRVSYSFSTPAGYQKLSLSPSRRAFTSSNTLLKMTIPSVSISSGFDGGNGKLNTTELAGEQLTVFVDIQKDPYTEFEKKCHSQSFYFRSSIRDIDQPTSVKYVLSNAGETSYPSAWEGSTTFFSTSPSDPNSWLRKLDTTYDASTGHLSWTHTHNSKGSIYFTYFPPYSYERHLSLISKCESAPNSAVESLGQTLDGREMECVKVGEGEKVCWIIHRQHPGENMAEFYAEGLLTRLLGLDSNYAVDGQVRDVLKMYTFYIVPNMCPDGAFRGHLRTNAGGQNLNREWCSSGSEENGDFYEAPTLERSPEVYHVLKKMDETGVDAFLDIHGDEELPFNFLAGSEGCPNWSKRLETLHGAFLAKYSKTNSDMQSAVAYDPDEIGHAMLNVCSNQIAARFDCLAATLEMPFKDCMSNPDVDRGWNGARSAMLGSSVLEALAYVGPYLREEGDLTAFGKEDAYVKPTSDYKSL
jgi:murein tripeptide amidase MpaA